MSEQSKASAFPDTVQPGIPQLPERPPIGWKRTPLSFDLYEEKRPVKMKDDNEYDLVTVKRGRGGVVKRVRKRGADISVKTQFEVKAEDFLISKRQIVHGACGIVPAALDGSTVSNEYAVLRSRGAIHLEFLKYLSHSIYFQQTCFHSSIGVHIEKMIFKTDKWFDWEFDLPPIDEQRRIAEILSTWDRAIESTEKLIANSEAQKIALMQQLLTGKKRLPGFSGDWRIKKLSELCTVRRGASPRPINSPKWFAESGRGWVRISDVTKSPDERLQCTEQYLSSEGAANSVSVDPGDLIMSICATIGVPKFVGIPACIHDGFVVFRDVAPSLALTFLFYVLEAVTERLVNSGQPGTQKNLNTSLVGEILVPDIAVEEQLAIAERLRTADRSLRDLADELKILKAEKSALMQQLLTGKRRVKVLTTQEEAA